MLGCERDGDVEWFRRLRRRWIRRGEDGEEQADVNGYPIQADVWGLYYDQGHVLMSVVPVVAGDCARAYGLAATWGHIDF